MITRDGYFEILAWYPETNEVHLKSRHNGWEYLQTQFFFR